MSSNEITPVIDIINQAVDVVDGVAGMSIFSDLLEVWLAEIYIQTFFEENFGDCCEVDFAPV